MSNLKIKSFSCNCDSKQDETVYINRPDIGLCEYLVSVLVDLLQYFIFRFPPTSPSNQTLYRTYRTHGGNATIKFGCFDFITLF